MSTTFKPEAILPANIIIKDSAHAQDIADKCELALASVNLPIAGLDDYFLYTNLERKNSDGSGLAVPFKKFCYDLRSDTRVKQLGYYRYRALKPDSDTRSQWTDKQLEKVEKYISYLMAVELYVSDSLLDSEDPFA